MKATVQALPAVAASVAVLVLAIGLFVPREQLPKWLVDRFPQGAPSSPSAVPDEPAAASGETKATDVATAEDSTAAASDESPSPSPAPVVGSSPEKMRPETDAELMNAYFTPLPRHPSNPPRIVDVPLPRFPGSHAVWGGTGRDVQGRVWIGACVEGVATPSARLFCYDTQTGEMRDAGDVVSALAAAGLLHAGEGQMKIHSKIIQAGDGHLYFASMDERGENPDGSQLPTWGGHLWRLRLPDQTWEHLHASPEALIAVAGAGRYVYALGYFGHVLIQFDTETGMVRSTTVGSVDGHVSRNILVDRHGHAYVPRVQRNVETKRVEAALVEFDVDLKEIGETALDGYCDDAPTDSHGITGVQPMADGSLAFVTHRGRLYHVRPNVALPADVKDHGWMHPLGEMPIESLFTYDGRSWLVSVAKLPSHDFEWVAYDLKSSASTVKALEMPARYAGATKGLLLYGSMTRDAEGAFYLVGTSTESEPFGPVVWRLFPPRQ
jgi:hypothetical protein